MFAPVFQAADRRRPQHLSTFCAPERAATGRKKGSQVRYGGGVTCALRQRHATSIGCPRSRRPATDSGQGQCRRIVSNVGRDAERGLGQGEASAVAGTQGPTHREELPLLCTQYYLRALRAFSSRLLSSAVDGADGDRRRRLGLEALGAGPSAAWLRGPAAKGFCSRHRQLPRLDGPADVEGKLSDAAAGGEGGVGCGSDGVCGLTSHRATAEGQEPGKKLGARRPEATEAVGATVRGLSQPA